LTTAGQALLARALDDGAEVSDKTTERILDAATRQFELRGLRRSSVEEVARRAGVSRMTVYRRFPQRDRLIEAAILRECRRFFAALEEATGSLPTLEDRLVESFVVALGFARSHPLLNRLLVSEPDALLPFLTTDGGAVLALVRAFLVGQISAARAEGIAPEFDPEPLAEILARLAVSFVLTPESRLPLAGRPEGRALAHRYLAPLIEGASRQ
jgi:AcrR family transcriptional regulator